MKILLNGIGFILGLCFVGLAVYVIFHARSLEGLPLIGFLGFSFLGYALIRSSFPGKSEVASTQILTEEGFIADSPSNPVTPPLDGIASVLGLWIASLASTFMNISMIRSTIVGRGSYHDFSPIVYVVFFAGFVYLFLFIPAWLLTHKHLSTWMRLIPGLIATGSFILAILIGLS